MLDLLVIGGGAAGTVAVLKAVSASKRVALVRKGYGALALCPGVIHLPQGVRPESSPRHPHRRHYPQWVQRRGDDPGRLWSSVQNSITVWKNALESEGFLLEGALEGNGGENLSLMNEVGNVQTPALALQSLSRGDLSQWKGRRVVLVNLEGVHHFPLERIREGILRNFGGLREVDLEIRSLRFREWGPFGGVPMEVVSRGMDGIDLAMKLAQKVRDLLRRERWDRVGFPPVLGGERHVEVYRLIQETVESPCFEWLPLSSGLIGLRWQKAIDRILEKKKIERIEARAVQPVFHKQRLSGVYVETSQGRSVLEARNFILATGKFFGGGVPSFPPWRESIFGAPLYLKSELMDRHSAYAYLNPVSLKPQSILGCGIRVDEQMRPLNEQGEPLFENLYAAGSLLGGDDDTGGGMGYALASGYTAVEEAFASSEGGKI